MHKEKYIEFLMLLITFEIREKPAILFWGQGGLYSAEAWIIIGKVSLELVWWHKPAIKPKKHWAFISIHDTNTAINKCRNNH